MLAAIRPAGKPPGVWALPKGRIDGRDSAEVTAVREVEEETGAHGRALGKLGDVRYWFNWNGERIFKVVSFFLVRYEGGRLGDIPEAFRHEVAEVLAAARGGAAAPRLRRRARDGREGGGRPRRAGRMIAARKIEDGCRRTHSTSTPRSSRPNCGRTARRRRSGSATSRASTRRACSSRCS